MSDIYHIISHTGEGKVTEKMSRFLAYAVHVETEEEARACIKEYENRYHDSRHVCWAYMIGAERNKWQLSDNGEPSGTAGKPILGQINSLELTDVVVIVVRYFGGIKLGTSGLISAYRQAAREALEDAGKVECRRMLPLNISFPYMTINDVMKIVKAENIKVDAQSFDNSCSMSLSIAADDFKRLKSRLVSLDGVCEQ